jgi:predicted phosphodiesterase
MVYAVISDIHSDIYSLNSVLNRIKTMKCDKIICLGDIVGYGENAEGVVQEIINENITCVCGNHEKALFNEEAFDFMNHKAKNAINANYDQLTENSIDFLKFLPDFLVENSIRFVHGMPPSSVYEYLSHTEKEEIVKLSKKYSEQIVFCGHTHENEIVKFKNSNVTRIKNIQFDFDYDLSKSYRYIINVGSVSQPRKSKETEKVFVLYDSILSQLRFIKSE